MTTTVATAYEMLRIRHHLPGFEGAAGEPHEHIWHVRAWATSDADDPTCLDALQSALRSACIQLDGCDLNERWTMPSTERACCWLLQVAGSLTGSVVAVEITDERARTVRAERELPLRPAARGPQ